MAVLHSRQPNAHGDWWPVNVPIPIGSTPPPDERSSFAGGIQMLRPHSRAVSAETCTRPQGLTLIQDP
jgi:hypothetical protein